MAANDTERSNPEITYLGAGAPRPPFSAGATVKLVSTSFTVTRLIGPGSVPGYWLYEVRGTDAAGKPFLGTVSSGLMLPVTPPTPLVLSPSNLSVASKGAVYSVPFSTSGGTGPYGYAIGGGLLPPGLTLDPSGGLLSGTPTGAGTWGFTVVVTDSTGAKASQGYTLTVS